MTPNSATGLRCGRPARRIRTRNVRMRPLRHGPHSTRTRGGGARGAHSPTAEPRLVPSTRRTPPQANYIRRIQHADHDRPSREVVAGAARFSSRNVESPLDAARPSQRATCAFGSVRAASTSGTVSAGIVPTRHPSSIVGTRAQRRRPPNTSPRSRGLELGPEPGELYAWRSAYTPRNREFLNLEDTRARSS